eukprot:scaffold18404_cov101-Isochrysis_galbana.AAC.1
MAWAAAALQAGQCGTAAHRFVLYAVPLQGDTPCLQLTAERDGRHVGWLSPGAHYLPKQHELQQSRRAHPAAPGGTRRALPPASFVLLVWSFVFVPPSSLAASLSLGICGSAGGRRAGRSLVYKEYKPNKPVHPTWTNKGRLNILRT